MKEEFAKIQAVLEEKYQEISDLYEKRPSWQEDLELIKRLKWQNQQKDELLKKAAEDMKMYKLELENRELSYNKMFGTTPNVGVINPIVGKTPGVTVR